jgi:hypothetical protein
MNGSAAQLHCGQLQIQQRDMRTAQVYFAFLLAAGKKHLKIHNG